MAKAQTGGRLSKSSNQEASVRDYLAEIKTTSVARPSATVMFAPPGLGKTSLGAAIPGRVFLIDDQERGIETLKASGLVDPETPVLPPAGDWQQVLTMLRQLAKQKHDYKALIIDTLGGMERLCHQYVCDTLFAGNWGEKGFASYQRGYDAALPEWRLLLNALDDCRDKGMLIMALTHSVVRPYKNPLGEDFDRYVPDVHHKTWNMTHRWADMVLFGNYHVEVSDSGKGRGGHDRVMFTEYSAAYEAKNRHGLPREIPMGLSGKEAWKNLRDAIVKARPQPEERKQ